MATGCAITRVSVSSTGAEGILGSGLPLGVTDDGRYVVFASLAENLVSGDTNQQYDVFRQSEGQTRSRSARAAASSRSCGVPEKTIR